MRLVNKGAPVRRYQNELKIAAADLQFHFKRIKYYQLYVEMANSIVALQRDRANTYIMSEKRAISIKIHEIRKVYRDKLREALNEN